MRALAALGMTLAFGGCLMSGGSTTQPAVQDENTMAASPANIASLTDVIQRNPNDPQAYNVRGTVLGRAGRHQDALADFNKAIGLDPNYAQAYANRGLVHRQMRRLDAALADYTRAIEIDANYAPAYVGRGIVYRTQGQAMPAFEDFNKAIALKPDNAQAYYNRGLLYQSQRQHKYAVDDFTTSLGLAQQAEPLVARGQSHIAMNDFKAAAADLDEAVQRDPESLQAWVTRGLAYERLGDKEKAAGSYARALNLRQNYEPAKQGFARVGGRTGQSYNTF
ncbi:MAG: tetratricopeptide repeat protein [Variibacter sp.]|nr:tetratricopeptide repeat protein [Variibacter sp.]